MGAGKSRIVVDYVQNTPPGATLILCPHKVAPVWPVEFIKYWLDSATDVKGVPRPPILVLDRNTVAQRADHLKHAPHDKIVVVNYDAAKMEPLASALLKIKWHTVVLDECHRVKTAGAKTSRFAAAVCKNADKIIGLSGTPLSTGTRGKGGKLIGGWLDLYGQARAIVPGLFGTSVQRFRNRYGVWMTSPFPKLLDDINQDELQEKMNGFIFHVPEEELAYTLPPETDQIIPVTLPEPIWKAYRELEEEFITTLQDETCTTSNALVKQLRMQQITGGHFQPDDTAAPVLVHSEKIDAVRDLIQDMAPEEKIVVFAKFTPEIAQLAKIGNTVGRGTYFVTGKANTSDAWKESTGGILLVQIQAGSEGIDLTAARYCIYCSLCHSLKDYLQSRRRVNRPGQSRPVTYYHIVATRTIDEIIADALQTKSDVVNSLKQRLRRH